MARYFSRKSLLILVTLILLLLSVTLLVMRKYDFNHDYADSCDSDVIFYRSGMSVTSHLKFSFFRESGVVEFTGLYSSDNKEKFLHQVIAFSLKKMNKTLILQNAKISYMDSGKSRMEDIRSVVPKFFTTPQEVLLLKKKTDREKIFFLNGLPLFYCLS